MRSHAISKGKKKSLPPEIQELFDLQIEITGGVPKSKVEDKDKPELGSRQAKKRLFHIVQNSPLFTPGIRDRVNQLEDQLEIWKVGNLIKICSQYLNSVIKRYMQSHIQNLQLKN